MNLIEKLEPAILILAIILGLILSNIEVLSNNTGNLINLFLCIMLYGIFLEVPLKNLKKSFPVFAAGARSGLYLGRQQGEPESPQHSGFLQELRSTEHPLWAGHLPGQQLSDSREIGGSGRSVWHLTWK